MDKPAPFVLILGMHRSGTSCLAGALETCGLFLGEVRRTGRFNARGYFELASLVRLHDEILTANGGSWEAPPVRVELADRHRRQLQQVADFYARFRPCGLKDPRLTVLLEAWEPLVGASSRLVASFRHPVAVARSLASRNKLPEPQALAMWQHYNAALVRRHQRGAFPLVEYDLAASPAYIQDVASLADTLGLTPDLDALQAFVSQDLEHQRAHDAAVPESCRDTYEYLRAHRFTSAAASGEAQTQRRSTAPRVSRTAHGHRSPGLLRRVEAWGTRQVRATLDARARTRFRARAGQFTLDGVRSLLLFVGNPRSGTTLVRSLLDAHPNIMLGNEVDVLERLRAGDDWQTVAGRIVDSADRFRRAPEWEGYAYDVRRGQRPSAVLVIGDKKAGASARALMTDVSLLDRVAEWSSLPLRIVHCVRNPFDVITTKTLRNGRPLRWNMARYFEAEQTAAFVHEQLGPAQVSRIHLEELIAEPEAVLSSLLNMLALSADRDYVDNCKAAIFDRPSTSRERQPWAAEDIVHVSRLSSRCPHLARYVPAGSPAS